MIPARFAPIVFGLFLSCMMSFIISGVSTLRTTGFVAGLPGYWFNAWITSWIVAFPVVLFVGPLARRLVARVVRQP